MKIIIVGIGKLGEYLTKLLVKDNNEVVIIDRNFSNKKDIINNEDVNYIIGNGLDHKILLEAGISSADLLISVMNKDEQNVMCCLLGKKLGVKQTICRIRNDEYNDLANLIKDELGLSMIINPESLTASQISRTLSLNGAIDTTTFFKGKLDIICLKIKEQNNILEDMMIQDLSKNFKNLIISAIERNGEILIPDSQTQMKLNDKLYITGTRKEVHSFLKYASFIKGKTKRVIIGGGSSISVYLARMLNQIGIHSKIIEINEERCQKLSELLPDNIIINADLSDQNILYEEGIEKCDAFISLTSIDEQNIVFSMFASNLKVPKIITKINHIDLDGIVNAANIDTVITPHKIVANQVVKYVRALKNSEDNDFEALYKITDDFEMLEFKVNNKFNGLAKELKDVNFKDEIIIVAIQRGKNIIFPKGNDKIKEKDIIVVVTGRNKINNLNDLLRD